MPFIIDAHQDLAYNAFTHGRDYLRPAAETRQLEMDTPTIQRTGHTLLGCDRDFTRQLGEHFRPHGVLSTLAVHDILEL